MQLGFSYVGFVFLLMLMIPNIFWKNNQPKNYEVHVEHENKLLLVLERTGEALVSCLLIVSKSLNIEVISPWILWLVGAFILMVLYEVYWIRYFKSERTMKDFYSSLLGIPVAGATLPVFACILLSIYGKLPILFVASIILGIGHIGIHFQHSKEL